VKRRFLFLQGMASPLFKRLGDWLLARGEEVYRINFCAGDVLYWRGKPAWNYRGGLEGLTGYLEAKFSENGITDIVLFCDAFPVHRAAIAVAERMKLRLHVFEEGYVRPNWVTLQRGPTHAAYLMPRNPQWYLETSAALSDPGEGRPLAASIWARAIHDMAYHAAGLANPLAYSGYRTHRPYVAPREYGGWARRYARLPWWKVRDPRRIDALVQSGAKYFFFPLQLNADVQVVRNSPFGTMEKAIEQVLASFAQHAPRDARLVIKNHPFDTGLSDFGSHIGKVARALEIERRVDYLETGGLMPLFERALGVVAVNSTVGFTAVQRGLPTKVIGRAVYDIARITHQGPLDGFWGAPQRPEAEVCRAFRNVLIHATQINGGLYDARGIAMTLEGCERLFEPTSRLEQLLERFPRHEADAQVRPAAEPIAATG
jgi:capsular polysaccharide export protein